MVVSRLGEVIRVIDELVNVNVGGPWEVDVHQGAYRLFGVIGERPIPLEECGRRVRSLPYAPHQAGGALPDL